MYVILWEFIIRGECSSKFEAVYGPRGDWARLFAKSEGYRETALLQDIGNPQRYVILDFWKSREAHERFQQEHRAEYQAMDKRYEALTVKETRLGDFEGVS